MADKTGIEWTDATWNIVTGCSVVSPGCTNCYAMRLAGTRLAHHPSRAGLTREVKGNHVWTGEVRFNEQWLTEPLKWSRPRRIFVCAHGDLFHESIPDEWIERVFVVMALTPQHTFQMLTKRAKRMWEYLSAPDRRQKIIEAMYALGAKFAAIPWPLPNVWLGVSCENQRRADERIPELLATPAAVRFVSIEPMLGPIDIDCPEVDWMQFPEGNGIVGDRLKIDWVIVGGESGPNARPMHPAGVRSIRDQCKAAGVPFLFKQWGEWVPEGAVEYDDATAHCRYGEFHAGDAQWIESCLCSEGVPGAQMFRVGKRRAGRLLDGVEHNEFPGAR